MSSPSLSPGAVKHRVVMGRRIAALAGVCAAALLLTGSAAEAAVGSTLDLRFDWPTSGAVTTARPPVAGGSAAGGVKVSVVSAGGGGLQSVRSRSGHGWAVGFSSRGNGIVAVTPTTAQLSPETATFAFSADVLPSGDWSQGSNVLQRGLADDRGQYKLQLDGGRPSCSIKGTAGTLTVYASRSVTAGVWHRIACMRVGSTVTLSVVRLTDAQSFSYSKTGATGSVATASTTTPLSIGGKLTPKGSLATWQPDQFRGAIDNVLVTIG